MFCDCVTQKVFDEQFYAGDEHKKPEFDDDLGDEGWYVMAHFGKE